MLPFVLDLEIMPIAISLDNYCYLITDLKFNDSVLVDPANPEPIKVGIIHFAKLIYHLV